MFTKILVYFALFCAVFASVGCRGDDEESCTEDQHTDLSGEWSLDLVVTSSNCDSYEVGEDWFEYATVTQNDRNITVELDFLGTDTSSGTVCGDSFSFRGSDSDTLMGCTETNRMSGSGTSDGTNISGRATVSYEVSGHEICEKFGNCTVSFDFTGERR